MTDEAILADRLGTLHVEYVGCDEVTPNLWNPNRQNDTEFKLLLRSMKVDGFTTPVVAVRITEAHRADPKLAKFEVGNIVIVDGEHRWRAAQKLHAEGVAGFDPMPVVFVDMTPEQMRVATLRHNRARGTEDYDLSVGVLRDLEQLGALGWAQEGLGLSDKELEHLLSTNSAAEALAADDFSEAWVPAAKEEERSARTEVTDAIIKDRDERAKAAPTAKERTAIIQSTVLYHVRCAVDPDEFAVIRRVCGATAAGILAVCRWAQEQGYTPA